eukprot:TRINITY_DN102026_c0_g1_i1.p1 TRINITY_DN102026_c0_g1~~TRINITY_DN102026_c0_g1_i1.p1  ORF type:complete len:150 (+),score=14.19 TRINITY_DN102026_c0_g1_i1:27-476(+)
MQFQKGSRDLHDDASSTAALLSRGCESYSLTVEKQSLEHVPKADEVLHWLLGADEATATVVLSKLAAKRPGLLRRVTNVYSVCHRNLRQSVRPRNSQTEVAGCDDDDHGDTLDIPSFCFAQGDYTVSGKDKVVQMEVLRLGNLQEASDV